jgi:hypothetical protein
MTIHLSSSLPSQPFSVILVLLILLLYVLLLGAPRRTIISRPLAIKGDILLKGLVG